MWGQITFDLIYNFIHLILMSVFEGVFSFCHNLSIFFQIKSRICLKQHLLCLDQQLPLVLSLISTSHLFLVDLAHAGVSLGGVPTKGLRLGEHSRAKWALDCFLSLYFLLFFNHFGGTGFSNFCLDHWSWGRAFVTGVS